MRYCNVYRVTPDQLTLDVAPITDPLDQNEMKEHLRIDHSDDDSYLIDIDKAATEWVERECNIAMVERTYTAKIPHFAEMIELPRRPLQEVTAIKYWSTDSPSVLTTLWEKTSPEVAPTTFRVNTGEGFIYRNYSQPWPTTDIRHDAVQITFVAGYGGVAQVPNALKHALLLLVADLYEHREDTVIGPNVYNRNAAKALLDMYRNYW